MMKTSRPMLLLLVALTCMICGCMARWQPPPPTRIAPQYYILAQDRRYDPTCACWEPDAHTLYYENKAGKATALTSGRKRPFAVAMPDDGGVIYLDEGFAADRKKGPRLGNLMLHTPDGGEELLADEVSAYRDRPEVTDDGIIFSTKDWDEYILRWDLSIENLPEE